MAYLRSMKTREKIEFDVVENDSFDFSNSIAEHALEDGAAIADHVNAEPYSARVTGVITSDINRKYWNLLDWFGIVGEPHRLFYSGRATMGHVIISDFQRSHDPTNADGFAFQLTLQQVEFAEAEIVSVDVDVQPQSSDTKDKGRQQLQEV